jgi:endonuclease/exonuclease/phosphatase family metal-dependent hydrolase
MRSIPTLVTILTLWASWSGSGNRSDQEPAAATLKVMTFNIQHGIDGSHEYNLQRAIETIASVQPDLVGLQEVTRNHPYYNCDDQPAELVEGLRRATGRPWSVAYEQEWFTPNVECQQSGRGDGKETEGLAFLAPGPLGSISTTPLPVSRIALAVQLPPAPQRGRTRDGPGTDRGRTRDGPPTESLAVVVTHLASGRTNSEARRKEIDALLQWSRTLGDAQILMGDFNARPNRPELAPVLTMFKDAWRVGAGRGVAKGDGATRGTNRIDYIFFRSPQLNLEQIETVETGSWFSPTASDHKPLVATFRLGR